MQRTDDIYFKDKDFPIKIVPRRTSIVDDVKDSSRALHEAIEIKYFYEGDSTLLIGTDTVHARAGDIVVINPYEVHGTIDYGKEEKGKYHLIMIGLDFFSSSRSAGLDLRHVVFGKQTVFKALFKSNTDMQKILTRVVSEAEAPDEVSRLSIFGLMAEFFALLQRCGTESKKSVSSEDMIHYYTVIEPAIRMMRDDYSTRFTVDTLAEACRISKYHFCRIFKAVMGMSAIQYLNGFRLKIADTMLTNTDKSISEIASLCGFEDSSYFSRIYKKHFGYTPKQSKDK